MTPAELLNLATKLQEAVNMIVATVPNEPEPEPEPEPVWPTAPLVWWDGHVWMRSANGRYLTHGDHWLADYMDGENPTLREAARRFAREAVPVVAVPAAEWEAFAPLARGSVTSGSFTLEAARALVRAADAQEVAR